MRAATLHGWTVAWDEAAAFAPLAQALFAHLPQGEATGLPDMALVEDGALAQTCLEGPLTLFHGEVEGRTTPAGLWVTDGHWHFLVEPGGRRIRGAQGPGKVEGKPPFGGLTLLMAFSMALRHHGLFYFHAAGLEAPGGEGVLIAGEGGAGKSSTTLCLLQSGFGFLGDDMLLLCEGRMGPQVLAFPRDFHVAQRTAQAFRWLAPLLGPHAREDSGKWALDARRAFPSAARERLERVHLLVFPRVTGAALSEASPLSTAEALEGLLTSSALLVVQGAARAAEHFHLLRELAGQCRAVELRLGTDVLREPGRLAPLLGLEGRSLAKAE